MKNKMVTHIKSGLLILFFSQSSVWSQITFLPFDEKTDEIISFKNMNSSSFVTGFFDYDNEIDSCYAIKNIKDQAGLYFEYGDGTSSSIGGGSSWTAMIPLAKKKFDFLSYDNLDYSSWQVCTKESVSSAASIEGTSPSAALIIKSVLKNFKIKYQTDIIYLGFENSSYALFRYDGEWLFVKLID
jgi:hypothetical protein